MFRIQHKSIGEAHQHPASSGDNTFDAVMSDDGFSGVTSFDTS